VTPDGNLIDVVMPKMGTSVVEGTVSNWLKAVGDHIEMDEPLVEVSTDKVETEIPSPVRGVLTAILVSAGELVTTGSPLARVLAPSGATGLTPGGHAPATSRVADPPATERERQVADPGRPGRRRAPASPVVVRLADELNIDIQNVRGSGPAGRVTREDLLVHARNAVSPSSPPVSGSMNGGRAPSDDRPTQAEGEQASPMSAMRVRIAQRMQDSIATAVHVTSFIEVDMSAVVASRARCRRREPGGEPPTLLAFVARAVVAALRKVPWLNAELRGQSIVTHTRINLGIAVSVDAGAGLIVPVIKDAGGLNLAGIAAAIGDLSNRARSKRLRGAELSGATFTITNLGGFGTFAGTPIINPPQVAILGMYSMVKRAVVVANSDGGDGIAIRPMMNISMSYDHRLIDGSTAGAFLRDVRSLLETWDDEANA
jgi:2-oxoglutarate dehydrogenase E2 component (dihydrolipoamide succinyltransferase)